MTALMFRHRHRTTSDSAPRAPQRAWLWVVREEPSRRNAPRSRSTSRATEERESGARAGRRVRWAGDRSHPPREGVVVTVYDDVRDRERIRVMDVRWDSPPPAGERPWGPVSVGIPLSRVGTAGWEWVDAPGALCIPQAHSGVPDLDRVDAAAALRARVGQTVRQLRKQLGESQETFAAACGVHRTFVGAVERGEVNLTLASLERLARGLAVDVTRLFAEPAAGGAEH